LRRKHFECSDGSDVVLLDVIVVVLHEFVERLMISVVLLLKFDVFVVKLEPLVFSDLRFGCVLTLMRKAH
jgi:hypothetical protein